LRFRAPRNSSALLERVVTPVSLRPLKNGMQGVDLRKEGDSHVH
jgi:hypothetical protein